MAQKIAANRWLVEGVIAVIGGKLVNEPYRRVHVSKAKAEADEAALARQNADGIAYLAEIDANRRASAAAYLAARPVFFRLKNQIALAN